MAMRSAMGTGELGVRLELPSHLSIVSEDETVVHLMDPQTSVGWHFLTFPGLPFDLGHREELSRALEPYARAMFDDLFQERARAHDPAAPQQPRTSDRNWSPMVEIEFGEYQGAPVLRTIHRMAYQPGWEIVMGHLLVPAVPGLFEARVTAIDHVTGFRESALFMTREGGGVSGIDGPGLSQKEMDDPRHDATFPQHALSRVRAALRWLSSDAALRVTAPAQLAPRTEINLPRLGCALIPPPRFEHRPDGSPGMETFVRSSFCGTDGLEKFLVTRLAAKPRPADGLQTLAERTCRQIHEESGVSELQIQSKLVADVGEPASVLVIAEGRGHIGNLRNTFWWFLDPDGNTWHLSVAGTAAVPAETRVGELRAAARTWRALSAPAPRRRWWKVW